MKAPTPKRIFMQRTANPVFNVGVTTNLINVGISTLCVIFVPMQDILKGPVSGNTGVHCSMDKEVHTIQELDVSDLDDQILHININSIQGKHSKLIIVRPTIAGRLICMELDTGTALSILSEQDYLSIFKDMKLILCDKTLRSYSEHTMRIFGKLKTPVGCSYELTRRRIRLLCSTPTWSSTFWSELVREAPAQLN